jgi:hypothetical protein
MEDQEMKKLLPKFPIGTVLGVVFVIALFTLMIISIKNDLTVIDTRVETIDGHIYDCTEARADRNEMTYIRRPYFIQIPTRSIKIIKEIN